MAELLIEESGMTFGPYDKQNVFYLEKSEIYNKLKQAQIRSTEFILYQNGKFVFLEAKSSTPNYKEIEKSEEKKEKYEKFISEITEKFVHSIDMFFSIYANRILCDEVPDVLFDAIRNVPDIILIVVIKNSYPDSLIHYQEALESRLSIKRKLWNIRHLLVIDEMTARKKQLVK